jgi:hypothetical protein
MQLSHMVSWLCSFPHASEWVAGQNLADPNTWNNSALHTLKQLHNDLLTHYNCAEWDPPLADDAPTTDSPAQICTVITLFPFLHITFSLLVVFSRMRTMAKLLLVSHYLHKAGYKAHHANVDDACADAVKSS